VQWRTDDNPVDKEQSRLEKQMNVQTLINQHRVRGHLIADLDPLAWKEPHMHEELDPATYGLTIWDLEREFLTGGVAGTTRMKLGDLLHVLRDAYCRTVGIEYMHISEPEQKQWIQDHVEGVNDMSSLSEWTARQFDPRLNWSDVEWIKRRWGGKLILKGIQDVEDAKIAVSTGADALTEDFKRKTKLINGRRDAVLEAFLDPSGNTMEYTTELERLGPEVLAGVLPLVHELARAPVRATLLRLRAGRPRTLARLPPAFEVERRQRQPGEQIGAVDVDIRHGADFVCLRHESFLPFPSLAS